MKTWVGIDVSKLTLDACWFAQGEPLFLKVPNDAAGFEALFSKLPPTSHLVMEATGAYYLRLAHFLMKKSVILSVVNPISIKRYAQMKLARAKTDKYDAAIIAQFGASQAPAPWSLPDAHILEMQQLCALEDDLVVQKGMLQNQKEAFTQNPFASKTALKSIAGLVARIEKEMGKVRARLNEISQEHYSRETEILCSIPGIGIKTAQALLVATRGFRELVNGRALCSYVGIAPRPYQSGTSVRGRGRISKMGSSSVRKKIYTLEEFPHDSHRVKRRFPLFPLALTPNRGCKPRRTCWKPITHPPLAPRSGAMASSASCCMAAAWGSLWPSA